MNLLNLIMFLTDISGLSYGSDKIVQVNCQSKLSEKCKKVVEAAYKSIYKTLLNNKMCC